jgi:hypothetical protein
MHLSVISLRVRLRAPCVHVVFCETSNIKTHAHDAFCNIMLLTHQIDVVG